MVRSTVANLMTERVIRLRRAQTFLHPGAEDVVNVVDILNVLDRRVLTDVSPRERKEEIESRDAVDRTF